LEILLESLDLLFFFVGRDVCVFYFMFLCFKRFLKRMKDKGSWNGSRECYESHDKFWHWSWIPNFQNISKPNISKASSMMSQRQDDLNLKASSMASQRQDDLKDKLYYYQITYYQVFLKQMPFKVHICEIYIFSKVHFTCERSHNF